MTINLPQYRTLTLSCPLITQIKEASLASLHRSTMASRTEISNYMGGMCGIILDWEKAHAIHMLDREVMLS